MSSVDTRHLERESLFLMAELIVANGAPQRVKVRNLSASGMMAESDGSVTCDERVRVELRNIGEVAGTVAWVQGRRMGIAFDREIDPKLARTQVFGGDSKAPVYARAVTMERRHEDWYGKLRPV